VPQTSSEQERNLWIASRGYVLGEIGIEELGAVEFVEVENFKNAVQTLAKMQLHRHFHYKLLKLWKMLRWKNRVYNG
jgi:hypothetical protein